MSGIGTTALQQVREFAKSGVSVTLFCTSIHAEVPNGVRVVPTLSVAGQRIPHRALGVNVPTAITISASPWPSDASGLRSTWLTVGPKRPSTRPGPLAGSAHRCFVRYPTLTRPTPSRRWRVSSHRWEYARRMDTRIPSTTWFSRERRYKLADFLLVPSAYSLQTFVDRGFAREKLLLHRYGYDPKKFYPASETDHADRDPRFTAIFVGDANPAKGCITLCARGSIPAPPDDGRFIVYGSFSPGYWEVLEPLLRHRHRDSWDVPTRLC